MKTRLFYVVGGTILAIAFGHASFRMFRNAGSEDVSAYARMTHVERLAEWKALRLIVDDPQYSLFAYFETLKRFDRLTEATKRARAEGTLGYNMGAHGEPLPDSDIPTLQFLSNEYTNKMLGHLPRNEEFTRAQEAAGYKPDLTKGRVPMDPLAPQAWTILYFLGLIFTFGHFLIRSSELGGSWEHSMLDWRFHAWLTVWPVGIFRYPTEVDVKLQIIRAYRLVQRTAVLLVSSSISLVAAGCGPKRVKTGLDDLPVDSTKSWRIDVNTITWPSYVGSNGAVFHPAPVQQGSTTVYHVSGFYLGTWHSVPLGKFNLSPNYAREIDLSGGWNGSRAGLNIGLDMTWVGVTPLAEYRGDVIQFSAKVSRDLPGGLSASATAQLNTPTRGVTPKRGLFLKEGLAWGRTFGRFASFANGELVRDSGAFGFNQAWLVRAESGFGVKIGDRWRAEFPVRLSKMLTLVDDGRRLEIQAGFRLAWQH